MLRAKRFAHLKLLGDDDAWQILQPVRRAIRHYHRADLKREPLFDNWGRLMEYLRVELAAEPVEQIRALFLDAGNRLICDEIMATGTVNQCQLHIRELMVRALDLHASNLILVHNHPSGDSKPSQQDVRLTRQVIEVARSLGIAVHDHIVIARDGHSSMRARGLL